MDSGMDMILKELNLMHEENERGLLSEKKMDSIDFVRLIVALEKQYGIEIPIEEMTPDHFDSVASMKEYINTKRIAR